jgi:hypothetical protein
MLLPKLLGSNAGRTLKALLRATKSLVRIICPPELEPEVLEDVSDSEPESDPLVLKYCTRFSSGIFKWGTFKGWVMASADDVGAICWGGGL